MIDTKVSDPKVKTSSAVDNKAVMPPQRTESRQAQTLQGSATGVPQAGNETEPSREEIAALAYQLWIERGSPHGSHEEDWHRAEQQLRGNRGNTDFGQDDLEQGDLQQSTRNQIRKAGA